MVHLFMIRPFLAKVCAVFAVCVPCFVEPAFAVERQEMLKGESSPLMLVEGGKQSFVHSSRFLFERGVENCQLVDKSAYEFGGRETKAVAPMDIDRNKSANKGDEKRSKDGSVFDEYIVQSGSLGFIARTPLLPYLFGRPNVK